MRKKTQSIEKIEIIHQYFGEKSTIEVNKMFGQEYCENFDDNPLNHYFIYINDAKPIVLFHICGENGLEERISNFPDLKVVLNQLPELTFDSILFALTIYGVLGKNDLVGLIQEGNKFEQLVEYDDLLSPTYGYVFYKFQLEQIIARISDDIHINPHQLRKGWNKKSHATFAEFNKLKVTDNLNLTEFLHQRTIEENHFVWSPNFRGAQLLWNYLLK